MFSLNLFEVRIQYDSIVGRTGIEPAYFSLQRRCNCHLCHRAGEIRSHQTQSKNADGQGIEPWLPESKPGVFTAIRTVSMGCQTWIRSVTTKDLLLIREVL